MSFPAGPSKQAVLCGGQFLTFLFFYIMRIPNSKFDNALVISSAFLL
jgi:hypothetical protein